MKTLSLYDWCIANNRQDILDDWDEEKNASEGHNIYNVARGSDSFKAYWKCHVCGHEWKTTIYVRTGMGCNCPKCGKRKATQALNKTCLTGRLSLYEEYKKLIEEEWIFDRNNSLGLNPEELVSGSNKEAWWKCPACGNEYFTRINHRTKEGHGCSKCGSIKGGKNKRRINIAQHNFKDWIVENAKEYLLKEWDYVENKEKYGLAGPQEISYGNSNIKIYWKCSECGYEWQADVASRAKGHTMCPVCQSAITVSGINDFATLFPDLLDEWDYDKNPDVNPTMISPSNKVKVHWICPVGHSYFTSVVSRARLGTGCPKCHSCYSFSIDEKIIAYYISKHFDISENHRYEFLNDMELDIYCPQFRFAIEYDGGFWHKEINKDLEKDRLCENQGIFPIRVRDEKCPHYDSFSLKIYVENPKLDHQELEKPIKNIFDVLNEKYGLNNEADVDLKRDYKAIVSVIQMKKVRCSVYDSALITEFDFEKNQNLNPKMISKGDSRTRIWWKCPTCHRSYQAVPESRFSQHTGCPYCGHNAVDFSSSFQKRFPNVLNYWDFDKNEKGPDQYLPNSNLKVWMKCSMGHSFDISPYHISRNHGVIRCPFCRNQRLFVGYNDLESQYPDIAIDWDCSKNEIKPNEVVFGTNRSVYWKCHICGCEWKNSIAARTKRKQGCPNCKKMKRNKSI